MSPFEINKLAQVLQIDPEALSFDQAVTFDIDGQHHFTLEENGAKALIITLSCPLEVWEDDKLEEMLQDCSYLAQGSLDYSIGMSHDNVLFLCDLSTDPTASQIENTLLAMIQLKQKYFLPQ